MGKRFGMGTGKGIKRLDVCALHTALYYTYTDKYSYTLTPI